jgi:outer membrane protein assembly factor BamE
MKKILISMLCAATLALAGCGNILKPYKIDVQQGNLISQRDLNKVRPGMNKTQIRFLLGTPLIVDPFHAKRWDYIYTFKPGYGKGKLKRVSLYFDNKKLVRIEGDMMPKPATGKNATLKETSVIEVKPGKVKKKGLLKRTLEKIGVGGD